MAVGDILGVRLDYRVQSAVCSNNFYYETTTQAGAFNPTTALAGAFLEVGLLLRPVLSASAFIEGTYAWVQEGDKTPPSTSFVQEGDGATDINSLESVCGAIISWRQSLGAAKFNGTTHISGLAESALEGNTITNQVVLALLQQFADACLSVSALANSYTARLVLKGTSGQDFPPADTRVWRPVTEAVVKDQIGSVRLRKSRIKGPWSLIPPEP